MYMLSNIFFFPFYCVLTQKESQPLWNSLQDGIGLFQVGCSSRGSCNLQQFSWQATFAIQTSYQPSYAGRRPGKVLLDSSVGSAGATGKINDLWVIYWFWQVGKLKLGKLPGVFCLKPSQVLFGRELCWGAGCPVIAQCHVHQHFWSTGHTLTPWTWQRVGLHLQLHTFPKSSL